MLQARVLATAPMMAHCVTMKFVLEYDESYGCNFPIVDDRNYHLYYWVGRYIEKMKEDLIAIGAWDTCGSRSNRFSQWS